MATKISTEILIIILKNVQRSHSTQDLYSSLLVNRIWCEITIPILWELTLSQKCCMDNDKLRKKALCIRTYISCMDTQARTLLIQNGFDLSSSPPQATFDYPSFTHKFIINNLVYFISIYSSQIISQQIISQNQYNNNNEIFITKSRILFNEICNLIINRCTFLDDFKLVEVPEIFFENFHNYSGLIGLIPYLPDAPKVFKKLESFTSTIKNYEDNELICPLYGSLTLICDNLLKMDLSLVSVLQVQLLEELISVQKRLENLSIEICQFQLPNLFWTIITKNETLKSLRLKSVFLNDFKGKSLPIRKFTLLQELYIEDCYGLSNYEYLLWASSFTNLRIFHYFQSSYPSIDYSQEFIVKILETTNTNLRNICIDLYPIISKTIFLAISNFPTKVSELTLYNLNPSKLLEIFRNNNFNELRRISFKVRRHSLDIGKIFYANTFLCQMAENLPESLETIIIKIDYQDPWRFSAYSLRKLFEGWCCNEVGKNKPRRLHIKLEEPDGFILESNLIDINSEHFKVIEEYGIQFNVEKIF